MGHPLRWNRTDLVYEVTIDTIQGRYLLRPSREVRDLIFAVMSRAQDHYAAVHVYAFVVTRNQATFLLSTGDEDQLPRFMAYVSGEISRKVGRLLDWSGKFWAGRYRSVPVLDEEAITERLRHVLSQGVAEGLVESPEDWPGASCVPALLGSMTLVGAWVDRDREARLKAVGIVAPPSAYVRPYCVTLSPLPGWANLPRAEQVARYQAMIDSIELEYLVITRGHVVDPLELQRQDPFFRPPTGPRQRLARLCHSTCATLVSRFRAAYRQFCAAFRAAASALARPTPQMIELVAAFPPGSNPRPDLPAPRTDGASAPWWSEEPPASAEVTLVDEANSESSTDVPTMGWTKGGFQATARPSAPPVQTRASPAARPPVVVARHPEQVTRPLGVPRAPPLQHR